jgi:glycogen phosphorylase
MTGGDGMSSENQSASHEQPLERVRTGLSARALKRAFMDNLFFAQGRFPYVATQNDYYMALAFTVRDRLLHRWISTAKSYFEEGVKTVAYLSAEFLVGPHLGNNLINLGIVDEVRQAVEEAGLDLNDLLQQEEEPGLGNGGLGRLAACYLDSLATLEIPAMGYGIRYEFGIFDQEISDGWQVEVTDKWLRFGNPWEIPRPEIAFDVNLGGRTESYPDEQGRYHVQWIPDRVVKGVAYDTPILGYKVNTCNTLRLWKAEACESFDFHAFNVGNYYGAVDEKVVSENITKVLYPNDEPVQGKRLRLQQQYFFVSCSLQDLIRLHLMKWPDLENFDEEVAVQLNDTHPAVGVAELMRLLLDEHQMDWDKAWGITRNAFSYTNHTLLPEALEKWPLGMFGTLLPRHMQIIYEINHRFLDEVRAKYPDDKERLARMSLIDESGRRYIRMANLASVGSQAVNGVAELHTELLKTGVLKDFHDLYPEKFSNKTNGVSLRRFVVLCNPRLTRLINSKIGDTWIKNAENLRKIEAYAEDEEFCEAWRQVKHANKVELASYIRNRTGVSVNPDSLFDIHVKRLHEYKRQHLNVLHIVTLYNRIKQNPSISVTPRTFIFAGKAAPGYFMAKLIIKLINSVADVVNNDPDVADRLKVVFIPDFNVKNAEPIYPAADLSEQISTAGKEASGTGNMKFSLNGALTIGTLDGANVEIREEVGSENFFRFGLTAEQVQDLRAKGYNPWEYSSSNTELRESIDSIKSGVFSPDDVHLFLPLVNSLIQYDDYLLLADYQSYVDCQEKVSRTYPDQDLWTRMSIFNAARMGKFSSDRSIREYCEDIWHVKPVPVELSDEDPTG